MIQFFTDHNLCEGLGIDAFWDKLPDTPDNCIAIFEYTGFLEEPWEPTVHRNVQIICRAPSAINAKANATRLHNLIKSSMDETGRIDFNDRFTQTTIRQTPFKINEDDKSRVVFGFNLGITTAIDD